MFLVLMVCSRRIKQMKIRSIMDVKKGLQVDKFKIRRKTRKLFDEAAQIIGIQSVYKIKNFMYQTNVERPNL